MTWWSRLYMLPAAAAAAELLQSCPTLCDPIESSPPGSPVPGILQARTLEWVAISFSNAWKWKVKVKSLSHVWLFATPWTVAYQAPLFMGFSRQEYWSGVPSPSLDMLPTRRQISLVRVRVLKKCWIGDFPDGPGVSTSLSNAEGVDSVPGWGAQFPHDSQPGKKNKKTKTKTEAVL